MGRKGLSGLSGNPTSSDMFDIDTSNLSGVQINALKYYAENGKWPKGLSQYQRNKLGNMIDSSGGLPQAGDYKQNNLTRAEAEKEFKRLYNQTKHSAAEESAKQEYMMFSDDMNAYLRGNSRSYDNVGSINTIKKSMTTRNTNDSLYRGVDGEVLGIKPGESVTSVKQRLVGGTFSDKGFLSTTMSRDVAKEFSTRGSGDKYEASVKTVMVLNANGAKTTLIKSGLSEVLISPNTKFKFTDVEKYGDTYYVYVTRKG